MAKTLSQYAEWLSKRDLIWPQPPKPQPVKATPAVKPLPGIQAVTWSVYGTLLRITDGRLLLDHPKQLRMQIALEKTIEEFNMWNSMSRKPGAPWQYLLQQYRDVLEERQMVGTGAKGDYPEVDASEIWRILIGRLEQNEYQYDRSFYGESEAFSEKVAYFFHSNLQGLTAAPGAFSALKAVTEAGFSQSLLADGQCFTLVQLLRALGEQGTHPPPGQLIVPECVTLSSQVGVRKPSKSLYRACLERWHERGLEPQAILHVGTRLGDDLAMAKQFGMRTALYAGDQDSLGATKQELKDPARKPDRLLTDLAQIRNILGFE